jgi:hypothetical protein
MQKLVDDDCGYDLDGHALLGVRPCNRRAARRSSKARTSSPCWRNATMAEAIALTRIQRAMASVSLTASASPCSATAERVGPPGVLSCSRSSRSISRTLVQSGRPVQPHAAWRGPESPAAIEAGWRVPHGSSCNRRSAVAPPSRIREGWLGTTRTRVARADQSPAWDDPPPAVVCAPWCDSERQRVSQWSPMLVSPRWQPHRLRKPQPYADPRQWQAGRADREQD